MLRTQIPLPALSVQQPSRGQEERILAIEHLVALFIGLLTSRQITETEDCGVGLLFGMTTRIAGREAKRFDVDDSGYQHIRCNLVTQLAWETEQGSFLDNHDDLWMFWGGRWPIEVHSFDAADDHSRYMAYVTRIQHSKHC